jgi:hypothetical protein
MDEDLPTVEFSARAGEVAPTQEHGGIEVRGAGQATVRGETQRG